MAGKCGGASGSHMPTHRSSPGLLPSTAVIFARRALSSIFSYLHAPSPCSCGGHSIMLQQPACAGAVDASTACEGVVEASGGLYIQQQRVKVRGMCVQAVRFVACSFVLLHLIQRVTKTCTNTNTNTNTRIHTHAHTRLQIHTPHTTLPFPIPAPTSSSSKNMP